MSTECEGQSLKAARAHFALCIGKSKKLLLPLLKYEEREVYIYFLRIANIIGTALVDNRQLCLCGHFCKYIYFCTSITAPPPQLQVGIKII